jgi:hypothetical protein
VKIVLLCIIQRRMIAFTIIEHKTDEFSLG